jgi:hypothetical protein
MDGVVAGRQLVAMVAHRPPRQRGERGQRRRRVVGVARMPEYEGFVKTLLLKQRCSCGWRGCGR